MFQFDSFIPCSERIVRAVTDMVLLFPEVTTNIHCQYLRNNVQFSWQQLDKVGHDLYVVLRGIEGKVQVLINIKIVTDD